MTPYEDLPAEAFWRTAVASLHPHDIQNVWKPKFPINKTHKIATSGSCFAQHISNALISRGYSWIDGEIAPKGLSPASQKDFNYGIFSFRTGNIYTAALLKQWIDWASNNKAPDEFWMKNDRFYDPFRPNVEPNGFCSLDELLNSRNDTLYAIRDVISKSSIFIFTLGLTEAWIDKEHNYVYPMCPGTVAGEFNEQKHGFINYKYPQIFRDLVDSFNAIKKINPSIRFILTVSPVPLTATASGKHVLPATTYSKSTLRAVAEDIVLMRGDVDYFPSYELISSFPFKGMFFQENLRTVTSEGVDFVMDIFFSCLGDHTHSKNILDKPHNIYEDFIGNTDELVCEEELLAAFGHKESHK